MHSCAVKWTVNINSKARRLLGSTAHHVLTNCLSPFYCSPSWPRAMLLRCSPHPAGAPAVREPPGQGSWGARTATPRGFGGVGYSAWSHGSSRPRLSAPGTPGGDAAGGKRGHSGGAPAQHSRRSRRAERPRRPAAGRARAAPTCAGGVGRRGIRTPRCVQDGSAGLQAGRVLCAVLRTLV